MFDHHSAQAPLMLPRPAAGAPEGVDDARASDLLDNANRNHLRAHALAVENVNVKGSTVLKC